MGAQQNRAFIDNPLAFIQENPVDLMDTLTGLAYTMGTTRRSDTTKPALDAVANVLGMDDAVMEFDLMPVQAAGRSWTALRPAIRQYVAPELRDFFPEAVRPAVSAYYFPYKTHRIDGSSIQALERTVGWADVPRMGPTHRFALTGSMNGCEFAITEAPSAANFRIWHFQNAASHDHPKLRKAGWPMCGRKVHYWHEFSDYGTERASGHSTKSTEADRMAAWNFLHFTDGKWWLYCQPLEYSVAVSDGAFANVPSLYGRAPYRVDLSEHLATGEYGSIKYAR